VRTEEADALTSKPVWEATPYLNSTGVGGATTKSSEWGVGEGMQRLAGRERRGGDGGGGEESCVRALPTQTLW
jgi:hypothetical protein